MLSGVMILKLAVHGDAAAWSTNTDLNHSTGNSAMVITCDYRFTTVNQSIMVNICCTAVAVIDFRTGSKRIP